MNAPIRKVGFGLIAMLLALIAQLTYVQVVRAEQLTADPQNFRVSERDFARSRGKILTADGVVLARAVLVPDGTGYLWSGGLPLTDPDRTYQLWAIVGTEAISAGVLGPNPSVAPFRITGDVTALAITEEVAGGVVASENQPVASGAVVEA